MKKNNYFCLLLCLLLVFACMPTHSGAVADTGENGRSNTAVTNGCHSADASIAFLGSDRLVENVEAAFLYEVSSDTLMYALNPDAQVYPASLVKILTALIAVEQGNPDDIVTVTDTVLSSVPYDAVSAKLQVDEQMSLDNLLYCMMVGSANDAAAVIADHISGDQSAFVEEMNRYAEALGCTGTQFQNVHGLHDENQYTTARDMARILSAAVKNEAFMAYFSAVHYTVPATNKAEARELSSGNFLMNTDSMQIYYDARVTGGRTGVTNDGKRCLATSAESNGLQLISIVMGAQSTFAEDGNTVTYGGFKETTALLDAGFNGYKTVQILFAGQALKQSSVSDGSSDIVLGPQVSISTVLPEGVMLSDLTFQYADAFGELQAPIEAGEVLSNVQVWYGNICIAQADLFAMNSVQSKTAAQNMNQAQETPDGLNPALSAAFWILGSIVVLIFLVQIVRRMRSVVARNRSKRYRRDRRRSR